MAYGKDETPIKRLIDMGLLPPEASSFRKDFFTCYDIESLENKENISSLRNVVGIHQIISIAVSTNRGHSKCFIRADSSHQAALDLIQNFLAYLDVIGQDYELTIPDYFHTCIEKLESLTSSESTISRRQKMELSGLLGSLKKYVIMDVYGFNSGKSRY